MADYTNPKAQNAILTDLQEIVSLTQANAKMDPSTQDNIPNGAKRLVAVTGGYQLQSFNGETWATIDKLVHDSDTLDSYHANTGTTANTVPVRNANGALPGDITGNAASASSLETGRTIDIGGIASATATSFDGSANITIPINSITLSNDDDDAVNGTLSAAHGGTGRTDGAASDLVVSSASGSVKASEYGQIGDAKTLDADTDLNSVVVSGNYISTSGTAALHYPYATTNQSFLIVKRSSVNIRHILFDNGGFWTRTSSDTGASWSGWVSNGSPATSGINIYISKSGSDDNTGLDNAYPVLTIDRALALARGYIGACCKCTGVNLYIGEGDWGEITIYNLTVPVSLYAYDGAASEYTSTLPVFTSITVSGGFVCLYGVVASTIRSHNNSCVYINGYNRFAYIIANNQSAIYILGTIDVIAQENHGSVFCAYSDGVLYFANITINIAESLTLSTGFLYLVNGGVQVGLPWNSCIINLPEDKTVTGPKYNINNAISWSSKANLDSLPGSSAGTVSTGSRLSTGIWGGGDSHTFMNATGSWVKDSSAIYARDVAIGGDTTALASSRGLYNKAVSKGAADLNTLLTPGNYYVNTSCTNGPGAFNGIVQVFDIVGNGSYIRQIHWRLGTIGSNEHQIYTREIDVTNSNFGAWHQIMTNKGGWISGALAFGCGATTNTRYESIRLGVYTNQKTDSDGTARYYYPFNNIQKGANNAHGLLIQAGGAMMIGSGTSASTSLTGDTSITGATQQLYLTSDNNIYIETNLEKGYANKKDFILGSSGNTWINQYLVLRNPNVKKGTNPSGNVYTNIAFQDNSQSASVDTSVRTGLVENRVDSSGNVRTCLGAYQFSGTTAFASIGVHYSADGTTYGFCPTPPAASDNTCIATTAWVRDRLTISTANPSGGTSGDIWFKY